MNPTAGPAVATPQVLPLLVSTGGSNFLRLTRLGARNTNVAELGISATDTLYLPCRADPVVLTNFSPIRQSNGDPQINLTGIDFTSFIGGLAWIVGDRPGPGVAGGRHRITVTPGADILAGALSDIAVTMTGAHTEGGVIANPRTNLPAGIAHVGTWVSAANTVTVRLLNTTGSTITAATAARDFYFWLAR